MEILNELNRKRRIILPKMRALQLKESKGTITDQELMNLESIKNQYYVCCAEIVEEKKRIIKERYGEDMLKKWIEKLEIEKTPRLNSSKEGKRLKLLNDELAEVIKLVHNSF